ncbi:MAG: hypothetical protein HY319_26585 [Armatimonadetes bacterium]|nr:hypothetical protein [Armatimonadota bacterium]
MARRELFWLIAVLVGIATVSSCGLPWPSAGNPTRVLLELSPTADFRESYRLSLEADGSAYRCDSSFGLEGCHQVTSIQLSESDVEELRRALDKAGVWELTDGDSGDAEDRVLYTRLEVEWGSRRCRTEWRGLPEPHSRIAQALLGSPIGRPLSEGLQAVQARKAR